MKIKNFILPIILACNISGTQDTLASPNVSNAVIDGADASGNDTVVGVRVGNHHQISTKIVRVSYRADVSDKIGRTRELAYQLMRRQQELRRDVEAIALVNQASVADNGSNTAGKVGGLPSWIYTNISNGASPGARGGFNTSTKLTVARTVGVKRALAESVLRTEIQNAYSQGGDVSVMMTVPSLIAAFSQYMLGSGSHVAQIRSTTSAQSEQPVTALGAVNVFVTDFGTIRAIPNRLQQTYSDSNSSALVADVWLLDPQYLSLCYLRGYQTDELAKTGLAENRQMSVDWSLIVHTEKAHALIGDVDTTTAMVAAP